MHPAGQGRKSRHGTRPRRLRTRLQTRRYGRPLPRLPLFLIGVNPTTETPLSGRFFFSLAVVDISPAVGKISPEFQAYINAMHQIQDAKVQSRKEADDLLQETEPVRFLARSRFKSSPREKKVSLHHRGGASWVQLNTTSISDLWENKKNPDSRFWCPLQQDLSVRQFLLTNLDRASPSDPYHFRIPLPFLQNAIDEIGAFPYTPGERVYEKPSLFLKGAAVPPSSLPPPFFAVAVGAFSRLLARKKESADLGREMACGNKRIRQQEQVHQLAQHPRHQAILPQREARNSRCRSLGCAFPFYDRFS